MPMYNSEKYISHTIKSIINQTYDNWELIIIDDCSTDNCFKIAKKYSKKDNRIKCYKNKTNIGISGNRNRGLKLATGDYIAFCDDDDLFDENLLLDNISIIDKYESIDMIKFGRKLISVDSNGKIFNEISSKIEYEGLVEKKNKYDLYFLLRKSDMFFNVWNGIYSKKLLDTNNIIFDENMKFGGEDADFSYKCYISSNNILINKNTYYIHYKRDVSSTSRKYNENKIYSVITGMETEFNIWNNIDFSNIWNQYYRIIALNINIDNIMFAQFFHKNSTLTYKDRKRFYNLIKEKTLNNRYILNKEVKKLLKNNNKKHYIITKIISTNNYFIIDMFYKFVSKYKNKKWK